jgi:hypothetical protein
VNWEPREYQVEGVQRMLKQPALGLLWQPGLGKTVVVLTALDVLRQAKEAPALVIAPLRVVQEVWRQEAHKWNHLRHLRVRILHGPHKLQDAKQDADIYLINYEGLTWLKEKGWRALKCKPRVLVLDESTAVKNSRSRRFQHLRAMLRLFKRRYILTGTPAPNGLMDLWAQMFMLDGGEALGAYITHYRHEYFTPTGYGGYDWMLKPDAEPRIHAAVAPLTSHLAILDHLDMPPLTTVERWASLTPDAREIYEEMEQEFVAELRDGVIDATNAGVRASKLRQITSGAVYGENGDRHWVHRRKYEATQDLIEELSGQPLLVAYEFDHEREALQSRLDWPVLAGKTSGPQTRKLVKAWNAGELEGLLVQPQAAGHGLNLQHGPCQQMVGRLWRQGQERPVFVHRLMARDTIDEHVWARVDFKGDRQQSLLDYLKGVYL